MNEFVNLRMSSHYSIEDNIISIDDIISQAKKNNHKSVAYTNKGHMFGVIDFYQKAIKNGLKPIVGIDSYIENDLTDGKGKVSRILLIAKNETGYKELMRLNSKASIENLISGKSAIKESWLNKGVKNIIALSGEDIENLFLKGFEDRQNMSKDEMLDLLKIKSEYVNQYKKFFPDGFFLELTRTGREIENNFIGTILNLSRMTDTPVVATQSALFKERKDYGSHLVRSALSLNEYVDRKGLLDEYGRGQYLLSDEEMFETFKDIPIALHYSGLISKMCNLKINFKNKTLPDYPTPNGETQDEYLRIIAEQGLEKKLIEYFPNEIEREERRKEYTDRMNYELSVISRKDFSNYFLFVSHITKIARDENITVGLGRGSAVGSLITTLIGITDVNPIKHGLYFERFLNPERESMPDIDLDVASRYRKKLINNISNEYNKNGEYYVAQIGTFNMYQMKSSISTISKVNSIPYSVQNLVRNALNDFERNNKNIELKNLTDLLNYNEKLKEEYEVNHQVKLLIKYVDDIIGTPANISRHASGVILSNQPLENYTPLVKSILDGEEFISSQYDKNELESINIIKFDILGLKNLDFTDEIVKRVNDNKTNGDKLLSIDHINYEDPQVYNIFKQANTGSVFQFESEQMKQLLIKVQADNFNDIVAVNALIRPGANKYIQDYSKRKLNNEKFQYTHPLMEKITNYTYGIMIYQEQAMQAAQLIAGFSLGDGELLRKAMSKKDDNAILKQKERFINGAKEKNNIPSDIANQIFEDIRAFSGYGFNKAHAVAYAMIAYKNAYLKHYHKTEFFTTLLEQSDKNDMSKILPDLYANGYSLRSPDINECFESFNLSKDGKSFTLGLSNIKGLNSVIAKKIIKTREDHGEFKDIYDFCEKVGREDISKVLFENMVYAGCFDKITPFGNDIVEKRSILIANVDNLINFSAKNSRIKKEKGFILNDLFGIDGLFKNAKKTYDIDIDEIEKPKLEIPLNEDGSVKEYIIQEKELINKEIDVSGVSLRIDPLEKYKNKIKALNNTAPLVSIDQKETNSNIFYGLIVNKKSRKTKKDGKDFIILTISDGMANKEIAIFDEKHIEKINKIEEGEFISFKKVKKDSGYVNFEKIYDWNETCDLLTNNISVAIKSENLESLSSLIENYKSETGSNFTIYVPENISSSNTYAMIQLPFKISVSKDFNEKLSDLLGGDKFVKKEYKDEFTFPYVKKMDFKKNGYDKNKGIKKGFSVK